MRRGIDGGRVGVGAGVIGVWGDCGMRGNVRRKVKGLDGRGESHLQNLLFRQMFTMIAKKCRLSKRIRRKEHDKIFRDIQILIYQTTSVMPGARGKAFNTLFSIHHRWIGFFYVEPSF